jgi:hypothetical protein
MTIANVPGQHTFGGKSGRETEVGTIWARPGLSPRDYGVGFSLREIWYTGASRMQEVHETFPRPYGGGAMSAVPAHPFRRTSAGFFRRRFILRAVVGAQVLPGAP